VGEGFRKAIKDELDAQFKSQRVLQDGNKLISHETFRDAERFIAERLEPLFEIVQALTNVLSCISGECENHFSN